MKVIITGGAGFIGSNAANRYLSKGNEVVVLDNLSRPGATQNLEWLRAHKGFHFLQIDVTDARAVEYAINLHRDCDLVLHLAAQVAVTRSVSDPRLDFQVNAVGTFNLLEALRSAGLMIPFFYASTNKVYGAMEGVTVEEEKGAYRYQSLPFGVSEDQCLDFHSPYGCSKGAADQYVLDYARIYGLPTVVFRQSCIYGCRQFGVEDQGWVAWFVIAAEMGLPITVYGNGNQVRDILFVDDLLAAYDAALERIGTTAGRVYNIGGGPDNAIAVCELLQFLRTQRGDLKYRHEGWRPGDQRIYISDIRRARAELGWQPSVGWKKGLDLLIRWVRSNKELFLEVHGCAYFR